MWSRIIQCKVVCTVGDKQHDSPKRSHTVREAKFLSVYISEGCWCGIMGMIEVSFSDAGNDCGEHVIVQKLDFKVISEVIILKYLRTHSNDNIT